MEQKQVLREDGIEWNDTVPEKEKINFSRMDCVISFLLLLLGFGFVHFVVMNTTGFFTSLLFIVIAMVSHVYLKRNGYGRYKYERIQFMLIIIFSLVFSITANNFIKFLNTNFLIILGTYWVYCVGREKQETGRFFFFDVGKAFIIIPFSGFVKAPLAISCSTGKYRYGKMAKQILLGLTLTFPMTAIVALLLSSADGRLEHLLKLVFGGIQENLIVTIIKFAISIPVAFYLFGMLYSNVNKEKQPELSEEEWEQKMKQWRMIPNVIIYSSVTPVCMLYVLFLVSQLQYFFSALIGRLPASYSFSEYARKGFFELCMVSVINLIILLTANVCSRDTGEKKPLLLKIYSALISSFTLLIIIAALSKMLLYIGQYGLTPLRIYTSWFMLLLFFCFVAILVKQFHYGFHSYKYLLPVFIIMFGILCFSKPDGIIARYNINMYQAGKLEELDVGALCSLSDDGLVYLLEQGIDTGEYLPYLSKRYELNPYQNYNLSSLRVKNLL